jgi:hypothetical protein
MFYCGIVAESAEAETTTAASSAEETIDKDQGEPAGDEEEPVNDKPVDEPERLPLWASRCSSAGS